MRKSSRYLSYLVVCLLVLQIALAITVTINISIDVPESVGALAYAAVIGQACLLMSIICSSRQTSQKVWRVAPRVFINTVSTWISFCTVLAYVYKSIELRCAKCVCDWSYLADPFMIALYVVLTVEQILFCVLDIQRGMDTKELLDQVYGVEIVMLPQTDADVAALITDATKQSPD